jgi:hypothetical protein
MSPGLPGLFNGSESMNARCASGERCPHPACSMRGVLMKPGAMALAVMPYGPSSSASVFVRPIDAALRRGVVGADAVATAARGDRAEVDDAAEAACFHARRELAAHQERGGEVRGKDPRPLRVVDLFEPQRLGGQFGKRILTAGRNGSARDIDEEFDSRNLSCEFFDFLAAGQVGDDQPGLGMDVGRENLDAFRRQAPRDRLPDAARRAGHQGCFPS